MHCFSIGKNIDSNENEDFIPIAAGMIYFLKLSR